MKLHLANSAGQNVITAYGSGFVAVNQTRYERSLIVLPQQLIEDWSPAGFDALSGADFERIARLEPELLLLGTGPTLRFPRPPLARALIDAGIGMEVMDTGAACRTFNILAAEGRRVAAALLLERS